MMRMQTLTSAESVDLRLARLAAQRYGVFTRAEALRSGATSNMIARRFADGRWERLRRGVYRLAGVPSSWSQSLVSAVLAGGDGAGASHRSAAAVWRFPRFEPGVVEISVRPSRRMREPGVIVHQTADLAATDIVAVDAIPVTTPPRTLIDLASVTPDRVEEALDDALRRRLTSLRWLEWCVGRLRRPGRGGIAVIERLLAARGGARTESPLEDRVLRLLRRAGLPEPVCQHEVRDGDRFVGRVDFAYPNLRLAIEADGYEWHSSRARWQRDLARGNDLLVLGWRVVHVTAGDLRGRPDTVLRIVEEAIDSARHDRA